QEELDSFPIDMIQECSTVLNSCVYDSILTITVQERSKRKTSVFLFQCEEVGADIIQKEIENVIKEIKEDKEDQDLLRNNLENMLFQHGPGPFMAKPFPMERWSNSDQPVPGMTPPGSQMKKEPAQWSTPDYVYLTHTHTHTPVLRLSSPTLRGGAPKKQKGYCTFEINAEIMNHLLNDIELFVGKLQKTAPPEKGKKKKKKKKKSSQEKDFPLEAEYIDCLQKTKFTFNQLSKLKNHIQNPSAEELVHVLFSTLIFVNRSPRSDLAPEIIAPLLTRTTIQFLTFNLTHEEKEVWKSLGDAWNISKSEWQNREPVPQYVPQFSDGWEPPVPNFWWSPDPLQSKSYWQKPSTKVLSSGNAATVPLATEVGTDLSSQQDKRAAEKPKVMRAMYDFVGRNSKELSIMKGNILQVLDESRQWWKVKTISGETGYIPNNILEPIEQEPSNEGNSYQGYMGKKSPDEEVTAWLTQKGFSKITVKCLGVLTGAMLLGMNREEIRQVCPEEAARVFAEIYAVKASSGAQQTRPFL
uniref:EPS8 signaling adaptor L3b n=1 Tax=Latimeria chalumnae TaxID=7897 RepID=H3AEN1_LATCH